jgi:hypothetical protein
LIAEVVVLGLGDPRAVARFETGVPLFGAGVGIQGSKDGAGDGGDGVGVAAGDGGAAQRLDGLAGERVNAEQRGCEGLLPASPRRRRRALAPGTASSHPRSTLLQVVAFNVWSPVMW